MRKVLCLLPAVAMLAGFTCLGLYAADSSQDISGGLRGPLRDVTIAVDQGTGNAVVVFNQSHKKKQEKGKIWLVELILQPNGSYQAGDPILVSSQKGSHQRPHVIPFYSSGAAGAPASSLDYYIIIWDTGPKAPFDPSWSPRTSKIMMRGYFPTWVSGPGPRPTGLGQLQTLVDMGRLELFAKGVHFGDYGIYHTLMVYYYSTSLDQNTAPTVTQFRAPTRTNALRVVPAGWIGPDPSLWRGGYDLNHQAIFEGSWGPFVTIQDNFGPSSVFACDSTAYVGLIGEHGGKLISGLGCDSTDTWLFDYTPVSNAPKADFFDPLPFVAIGGPPPPGCEPFLITNVNPLGPEGSRITNFSDCEVRRSRAFPTSEGGPIVEIELVQMRLTGVEFPPAKSNLSAVYHTADGSFRSRKFKPNGKVKKKEKVLPWTTKQDRFGGMGVDSFGRKMLIAYVEYKNKKKKRSTVRFGAAKL